LKPYPSIENWIGHLGNQVTAFYKYDGSNLRVERNKKGEWKKFGTRTRLFDEKDPDFGSAIAVFKNTYEDVLNKIIKTEKIFRNAQNIIAYMEFFGPRSFAGQHHADDPKELMLFDVNVHKLGFLGPKDFINIFGEIKSAKVVYQGALTQGFVNQVKNGEIPDLVEGVICKYGTTGSHNIGYCKIKTNKYLEELKLRYSDWEKYWE